MTDRANQPFNLDDMYAAMIRIVCSSLYFVAIVLLLRDYAAVEWGIYRIHYDAIDSYDVVAATIFITVAATVVPRRIYSPSSLFLIICYLFVIIPAAVCLLAMDGGSGVNRYTTLFAILFAFVVSALFSRSAGEEVWTVEDRRPVALLGPGLMILSGLLLIFLFYRFGSIMSFAGLDNLYEQRERGDAANFIEGYAQTYSQYVLSTGLFAFGLYRKNIVYVMFGLLGSLTNFAITAEKAGVMYPVFIACLFAALASRKRILVSINAIMLALSLILIVATYTRYESSISDFICWYLGTRTVLTPGLFIAHYTDFFFDRGYTYFSHIRGLNLFIPIPVQYASDPRWPAIGLMVGEDFIGFPKLNANANFVASDGIASMGLIGIFVSFLIFSIIFKIFDYMGRGIPKRLLLPLLLSIALTLTNGSALSVLTSTGGFLWMIIFRYAFVRQDQKETGEAS